MSKRTEPSFEAYCKCFAGVFRKHTHDEPRAFFTCYVRDAIHDYVDALFAADYSHPAFEREANGARYAWVLAGSPDITDCLDPAPDDDDY